MTQPRKLREYGSANGPTSGGGYDHDSAVGLIDPRALGLVKTAYTVREALHLLSIGRTSLYAAIKRGGLKRVKFGKKTLFYAADLASFLVELKQSSETDAYSARNEPSTSKSAVRS